MKLKNFVIDLLTTFRYTLMVLGISIIGILGADMLVGLFLWLVYGLVTRFEASVRIAWYDFVLVVVALRSVVHYIVYSIRQNKWIQT